MIEGRRIAVVVPAHDEEERIARTLRTMPACLDVVIVVDDGSADRTASVVRGVDDARITLVSHARNRGVGAAIVTGYRAAFAAGAHVAIVMGADGQMDPSDLPSLASRVVRGEADYAKGNRFAHASLDAMPIVRRVGNRVFSALTSIVTGYVIRDAQCGYTAISREAAAAIELDALWCGYGYPNDLLARAADAGLRVVEVPVRAIYAGEASGIGLREGLIVIPSVIARAAVRRWIASGASAASPTRRATSPGRETERWPSAAEQR